MPRDAARRDLERAVGALILPEVRARDTRPGAAGVLGASSAARPDRGYLERFPPAGLVLFGRGGAGPVDPLELLAGVRADLDELGAPAPFAACDLEQGAGLHLPGATRLPPALALAAAVAGERARGVDSRRALTWVRTAGAITAREARARGVELVLAPVVDVDARGDAPIVAERGFGPDAGGVATLARAFHRGLALGGAAGCAKHFPGHGAARADSHVELPRVERVDLEPFRTLIEDGVACVMAAHLDAPALTGAAGLPTSLAPRALGEVLRGELGFRGVVLSDALDMGALAGVEDAAPRALAAGCDGLLAPRDPLATAERLCAAVEAGTLPIERVREASGRLEDLRASLRAPRLVLDEVGLARAGGARADGAARARFAVEAAGASLFLSGPRWAWKPGRRCEVLAPLHPVEREEARALLHGLRDAVAGGPRPAGVALPVVCELRAGSGTYGPDAGALAEIQGKIEALRGLGWPVGLLWFGAPGSVPEAWWGREDVSILVATAPTPPQVEAVRGFLSGRVRPAGCRPGVAG